MAPRDINRNNPRAGRTVRYLRIQELGLTSQKSYAASIGASPRQVSDAESGKPVGPLTKTRIEKGFGWNPHDYDRLVDTGEHPAVTRASVTGVSPEEIARAALAIAKIEGFAAAEAFVQRFEKSGGIHVPQDETSDTKQSDAG